MNYRGFENFKDIRNIFLYLIVPHIGEFHLDFGCGDGFSSFIQAILCPNSFVVGYDNDLDKIETANKKLQLSQRVNLVFKSSLDEWKFCSPFNSATANFVFHENLLIFEDIYGFLNNNGKICVLDYNMKGISRRDFYKRFSFDNEKRIIEREGFETAYKKHTAFNLDDCINFGERAGFKTNQGSVFNNYFVWIGIKN